MMSPEQEARRIERMIRVLDPDNTSEEKKKNDKFFANKFGYPNFEAYLLETNPKLLHELQMQTPGGRFAILMRMPPNSPIPADPSLKLSIKHILYWGGTKSKAISEHSIYWTSDVAVIEKFAVDNNGKKPSQKSENKEEANLGRKFRRLSDEDKEYFYKKYPHWRSIREANIIAIEQFAVDNNLRKPNNNSKNKKEASLGNKFNNLSNEDKEYFYKKYPHWRSIREANIIAIEQFAVANNERKPSQHSKNKKEVSIANKFQYLSNEDKEYFYKKYPHWRPKNNV